jgi:hypothetical protein
MRSLFHWGGLDQDKNCSFLTGSLPANPVLMDWVEGSYKNMLKILTGKPALQGGKLQLDTHRVHFGFVDGN